VLNPRVINVHQRLKQLIRAAVVAIILSASIPSQLAALASAAQHPLLLLAIQRSYWEPHLTGNVRLVTKTWADKEGDSRLETITPGGRTIFIETTITEGNRVLDVEVNYATHEWETDTGRRYVDHSWPSSVPRTFTSSWPNGSYIMSYKAVPWSQRAIASEVPIAPAEFKRVSASRVAMLPAGVTTQR
jgi:hypothetical protein